MVGFTYSTKWSRIACSLYIKKNLTENTGLPLSNGTCSVRSGNTGNAWLRGVAGDQEICLRRSVWVWTRWSHSIVPNYFSCEQFFVVHYENKWHQLQTWADFGKHTETVFCHGSKFFGGFRHFQKRFEWRWTSQRKALFSRTDENVDKVRNLLRSDRWFLQDYWLFRLLIRQTWVLVIFLLLEIKKLL